MAGCPFPDPPTLDKILPKTSSGGQTFRFQDIKKQRERRKTKAEEGRQARGVDGVQVLPDLWFPTKACPSRRLSASVVVF